MKQNKTLDSFTEVNNPNASQKCSGAQIKLSGTGTADMDNNPCESVVGPGQVVALPNLEINMGEPDVRLIPHAINAAQE